MTAWFKREKEKLQTTERRSVPDGLWEKCPSCGEILFRQELAKVLWVCQKCDYHFRIKPQDYVNLLLDGGKFEERDAGIISGDPLQFSSRKKYTDQVAAAQEKTGQKDVLRTVTGKIGGQQVIMGIMDFSFIGGSMGSVVGEKLSRAITYAIDESLPLITIAASGGARMQEGIFSLMQLAKTSAKLAKLAEAGGLHISILTDPTTGGVSASYGMLGDFILAEPGALIGFAGPRVIKQTIGQDLPEGFQRAEFVLEKGFLDHIVTRSEMKEVLIKVIKFAHV
ncbi:MAG: acetyl-CoA carboxylase, carboxyltransferase subunit beta [Candidatus Marinimicrobia bacterium]|jgi:acetyl-CoA carboxylase carboxyl transferase subunit beta|nr:acetyl-CoA carboxylase, carboxyltransferase subunit beta [Candidatus Neomarinimicrobiota bacterium]MDP6568907.1 acetyl-CoA carboxylase, carboxyltransferase subunit beta [Candidatus Neomarinimicrobiota bacterium]MDP7025410.1 acetyl-CoA carboxylase, carboxyltransferase subunit beta [Candidatus Neomarinimicrobiota bacterium]